MSKNTTRKASPTPTPWAMAGPNAHGHFVIIQDAKCPLTVADVFREDSAAMAGKP